jgi:hypothetical protein
VRVIPAGDGTVQNSFSRGVDSLYKVLIARPIAADT